MKTLPLNVIPQHTDAEDSGRCGESLPATKTIISERLQTLLPRGCHRVLLITPPESPEKDFNRDLVLSKRYPCFPPYGPGILARNLEQRGYRAALLDLNFQVLKHAHENPSDFRFQIWKEHLIEKIEEFQPDIIGISVMFTISRPSLADVAAFLKANFPSLPIIAGGVCVSNDVESILRAVPQIDIGSFYEGDRSFPDLLDVINGKQPVSEIRQVAMLKGEQLVSTKERATPSDQEMDIQPEYYDLPIGDYTNYGSMGAYNFMRGERKASTIISNRGCRAMCSFCAVRNFNDISVRGRAVSSVVDEVERLYSSYGVTHFMWLDDDLLYNGKRAIALFNEITRRNLHITWDASNGLIAAAITPEIMQAASESGCIGFNLGLESGNDRILKSIHKPGTTKSYRQARVILDQYPHVFVKGFMIIGFPHETIAQIRDTVNLGCELQFGWYPLQLLTTLPGTEITLSMIEQGLIRPPTDASFKGLAAGSKSKGGGTLRQRERAEKHEALAFVDLLQSLPADHVPTAAELDDLWFVADYKMNYEKLLHIDEPVKLRNIRVMLQQITDEYTVDNAMGNLFLAVIASKLHEFGESQRRLALAKRFQEESAYWTTRFTVLGMSEIAGRVRAANARAMPLAA
ncbi:MAG: radical SAM protein [Nitrospira sp.]|nr:radical SAM protein [Nitrospira sp.]